MCMYVSVVVYMGVCVSMSAIRVDEKLRKTVMIHISLSDLPDPPEHAQTVAPGEVKAAGEHRCSGVLRFHFNTHLDASSCSLGDEGGGREEREFAHWSVSVISCKLVTMLSLSWSLINKTVVHFDQC